MRQDLTNFNEIAFQRTDAVYKRYVDSIFQVSVSANRQLYDQMTMEDKKMCEALKDLLKEDIAEDIAAAEASCRKSLKNPTIWQNMLNLLTIPG